MPSSRGASSLRPDVASLALRRGQPARPAFLVVSALGLLAAPAHADTPPSVGSDGTADASGERATRAILLVRTPGDDGVMSRVRAELRASAWRILELRLDDGAARVAIGELGRQQAVRAAVRFDRAESKIELWLSRAAGSVDETLAAGDDRGDDAVLALRITEALRARGLSVPSESESPAPMDSAASPTTSAEGARATPAPSAAPALPRAPKSPEPVAASARRGPRADKALWLEVAPALAGGPGGLGYTLAGWAGLRLEVEARWSLSLLAMAPVLPHAASGPEGTADVRTFFIGGGAQLDCLRSPSGSLDLAAGLGWSLTTMHGDAISGYVSAGDSASAVNAYGRARARARLWERGWLSVGLLGGVSFPEISVQFADRVSGRRGRPWLAATVGVELLALRLDSTGPPATAR